MEQNDNNKELSYYNIPVISFREDSKSWEPVGEGNERSRAAATYKNQLDKVESIKASMANRPYEPQWEENEWRTKASENRHSPKKTKLPRWFNYFFLLAAAFYLLWLFAQRM